MGDTSKLIAFGPVPSRRLGQSLGINNIPPKSCTYSCIYCQVGRTQDMIVERKEFYKVDDILREVGKRISKARDEDEAIDYLTFVSDGEPTLDINLGREIETLKPFGIKVAVITNASLVWGKSVKDDLCRADWVSVKIDAVSEDIWRKVNRPYRSLKLKNILRGISEFSDMFTGTLATETMLVEGVNDGEEEIKRTADFISGLKSPKSYISIPTRPPTEKEVRPPDENTINRAYQIFVNKAIDTEYLIGYEGNAFAFTGDVKQDLLSITSVHPMKEEAVVELLNKAKADWNIVETLIAERALRRVRYRDQNFYVRKI
ncbi:MAG: radical SAM protein [Candidatus Omnitrophica bacterium]|nr:radical SAM protein [Candidatus Omnitrophota bacterium]